jgi:hypothetical protein
MAMLASARMIKVLGGINLGDRRGQEQRGSWLSFGPS